MSQNLDQIIKSRKYDKVQNTLVYTRGSYKNLLKQ